MVKWVALSALAVAIVVAAVLIVGELRYRDCVHQRQFAYQTNPDHGYLTGPKLSYAGCSRSPF